MKPPIPALLLLSSCGLLGSCGGNAAPTRPGLSESGRRDMDHLLDEAVAKGEIPAVVTAVVGRDGILYLHAAGSRDVSSGEPLATDSIFRIFSMTKPLTSVAAMMLVEEGKMKLDDPVSRYLPAFESVEVLERIEPDGRIVTRAPTHTLTLRHLLTHTSGIGYAFSNRDESRLEKLLGRPETELPLVHDPGERWTYGPSTKVLGDVIERVSGLPLDQFLRKRIVEPLDMTDTAFDVPDEKRGRVVTVHQRGEDGLVEQPNPDTFTPVVRGDYGLYSTAPDYAKFLQMLLQNGQLGGVRILKPETVAAMTRNQIGPVLVEVQPALSPELSLSFPRLEGRDKFGLGFQIAEPAEPNPGRRTSGSYGWSGVMNTYFWVDPSREIAVVAMMQILPFGDSACGALMEGLEAAVYGALR